MRKALDAWLHYPTYLAQEVNGAKGRERVGLQFRFFLYELGEIVIATTAVDLLTRTRNSAAEWLALGGVWLTRTIQYLRARSDYD